MIQEIILTKEECDWILSKTGEFYRGHITHDGITTEIDDIRTCYEYTFENNQEINNFLLSKIKKFGISSLPTNLTVVRYEVGQKFGGHVDRGVGHEDRIKTVSIQLSDYTEYEGGEFMVSIIDETSNTRTDELVLQDIGNIVIFDSDKFHYVDPILEGTRYAIVFWLRNENLI